VLTPHEGELGRLLEAGSDEIAAHRLARAREAAERSGRIRVAEGRRHDRRRPGGPVAISPGGTPALATAGTGDVLSGIIGALLSKGVDAFAAACAGVLVHSGAGRHAARHFGADHNGRRGRHRRAAAGVRRDAWRLTTRDSDRLGSSSCPAVIDRKLSGGGLDKAA